jgi:hypothetical protein
MELNSTKIERGFDLKRDGMRLLGLIVAEWKSDPMSVQCFDLRIVKEAKAVVAEYERLPDFAK